MANRNAKHVKESPFTNISIENAFGEEVHMFLHIHLRGYDRIGTGDRMDSSYYDKYGAPVTIENSWIEGYHAVEKRLAMHFNHCTDKELEFPLVAGMSGGAHLYGKVGHDIDPWNWTGWIPLHRKWLCNGTFFKNRHFLALRGNEIQNNLWDYHPHEEAEGAELDDSEYEQIAPIDEFQGGYFYHKNPFGRYLHIIALKSYKKDEKATHYKRYNYIVHPLAYRASIDTLPDNSVDAMQWSITNIAYEPNFNSLDKWGDKVDGLEVFNDFTYYYSYQPIHDGGIHNGEMMNYNTKRKKKYMYWFDTYPLEYALFLLETALSRGTYLQTIAANDAFYERATVPPIKSLAFTSMDSAMRQRLMDGKKELLSDPKGSVIKSYGSLTQNSAIFSKKMRQLQSRAKNSTAYRRIANFLEGRPYKEYTAFGYTALIDTQKELKKVVYETGDLNDGEMLTFDYLKEGQFYSHTGVYNLFQYDVTEQTIPYVIQNQSDKKKLCYDITEDMELVFDFPKCRENKGSLIWRYTMMSVTNEKTLETVHGYFKLNESKKTKLDLSRKHDKSKVMWLYFTAIMHDNPQKRAWFSAVRGMAFDTFKPNKVVLNPPPMPSLKHQVVLTEDDNSKGSDIHTDFINEAGALEPFACESGNLDFTFDKCTAEEENNIYVYSLQVNAYQQDLTLNETKASSKDLPPRILENVHGYFRLNDGYPTRLNLSRSWDKATVKDGKVLFYAIDVEKGVPIPIHPTPALYSDDFEIDKATKS